MRPPSPIIHAALLCAALLLPQAAQAQSEKFVKRWNERLAGFEAENEALPDDARPVLLFGSSSMEGWKNSRRMRFLPTSDYLFLNRGISGDGIGLNDYGLFNRLQVSVYDARPSFVFILNGRNSIGRSSRGVRRTAEKYGEVVAHIQASLPDAVVCVVTCAPVNHGYADMAPYVLELNAKLAELAAERECPLIDLFSLLVGDDGLLKEELTRDGLHFKDEGYRLLGEQIARVLRGGIEPAEPAEPAERPRSHEVQAGETLSAIAKLYGTSWQVLAELNELEDPNRLVPGQLLILPSDDSR